MAATIPAFDLLNAHYPNFVSVHTVKKLIGGGIDDTGLPPEKQWLGGDSGNTCTIRLSRCLNYSGVKVPRGFPGLATADGADHLHYAFRVREMRGWLNATCGPPALDRTGGPPISRAPFLKRKGIIGFEVPFSDATGHFDLWDGATFYDEVYGMSHPGHDFFDMATRVSLWPTDGGGTLEAPPDAGLIS